MRNAQNLYIYIGINAHVTFVTDGRQNQEDSIVAPGNPHSRLGAPAEPADQVQDAPQEEALDNFS